MRNLRSVLVVAVVLAVLLIGQSLWETVSAQRTPIVGRGGETCVFTQPERGKTIWPPYEPLPPLSEYPYWTIGDDPVLNLTFAWEARGASGSGYTASLSGPDGVSSVPISGSSNAFVGDGETKSYRVSISQNGSPVTSCGITISYAKRVAPIIFGIATDPLPLPPRGSYTITGKNNSTFPVAYNYSPPLVGPTLEIMNAAVGSPDTLGFQLGSNYKGIVINRRAFKGPVLRWDISDPLNPRNPQKFDGMGPMPVGDGPIGWRAWGHEGNMGQVLYAESPQGDGRIHIDYANYFTSHMDALVATVDSASGRINLGQKYSGKYRNEMATIDPSRAGVRGPGIVIHTPSDKYFAYFTTRTNTRIFDVTDLSWSYSPEHEFCEEPGSGCLEHLSTVSWPNVSEWKVLQYPGQNKQYLLATSPSSNRGVTVRTGEIDPETGRVLRPKSQAISPSPGSGSSRLYEAGFTKPQPAYVNGKIYVLALEDLSGSGGGGNELLSTIGVYLLNESQLNLTKTGSIKVKTVASGNYMDFFTVLNSEDGTTHPLLEVFSAGGETYQDEFRFYSLQNKLTANSELTSPEFALTAIPHLEPLIKGEVVHNQYPATGNGFLKRESGKTYVYIYRTVGVARGGRVFQDWAYQYSPIPSSAENRVTSYDHHRGQRGYKGDIAIRVDKIDVSSLAPLTGYNPPSIPPGGTPPGGTPSGGDIGSGGECQSRYSNNIQLRTLCEQIEALKAQACRLNSNLSFCAR